MKPIAIKTEYVGRSTTNRDYLKFKVTYKKNGKLITVPAYGKGMQDALSRLNRELKKEQFRKDTKQFRAIVVVSLIVIIIICGIILYVQ